MSTPDSTGNSTGTSSPRTSRAASTGVVHVIAATLRADAAVEVVEQAVERARALEEAPGARHVIVARSDTSLLAAIWLDDRAALEPFAASPQHMAFVMRGLAPCISGMWSAAVETTTPPPDTTSPDANTQGALWVFAVRASDSTFEWQVRDLLESLATLSTTVGATVAAGPTFEERDRYRAGGVAAIAVSREADFTAALAQLTEAWGELADDVVQASAAVVH